MRKNIKALWKASKENNVGFTLIELIVAIAILGVVSASVGYLMFTSSKAYRSMSEEAKIQSEAQLVANSISELAVDAYSATNKLNGLMLDSSWGLNSTDGKVLVLNSRAEGKNKQYVIALNNSSHELWVSTREYSESSGTWGNLSEPSLLSEYVNAFTVDESRIAGDKVVSYTLEYIKGGMAYRGNWQVLMRNQAYADEDPQSTSSRLMTLVTDINPEVVYLDVVNGQIPTYYIDSVATENARTALMGVEFVATCQSNRPLGNRGVSWKIEGGDDAAFYLSEGENQDTAVQVARNTLKWTDAVADTPVESFNIVITKSVDNPDGEGVIEAQPRIAKVMLRRINSITVNATGGATQWTNRYTDEYNGVSSTEAAGYAYTNNDRKYVNMTLNASILQSNVSFGGGLTWKLEKKNSTADEWGECSDSFAKLTTTESDTSTSTQVEFGAAVANGQLYRVTATSKFDPSVSASYIFGVAPKDAGNDAGFHSRGFYVDLSTFVKAQPGYESVSIAKMRKGTVTGSFNDQSDIRVEKAADGRWYLYVSYEAFSGAGADRSKFYSEGGNIQIHITQTDSATEDSATVSYDVSPVVVTKVTPQKGILVLQKGNTETVSVRTSYHNIISERYFGVYLEDMDTNINTSGLADSNRYITTRVAGTYGDAYNYVENMPVDLTAKTSTTEYNPNPMTLRLAADDYYVTSRKAEQNAYTDYTVYISNVSDAEVFIPTPDTTRGACTWPDGVGSAASNINGYDANGNLVTNIAKVYVDGNRYKCQYMGSEYTYNRTYHYWYK